MRALSVSGSNHGPGEERTRRIVHLSIRCVLRSLLRSTVIARLLHPLVGSSARANCDGRTTGPTAEKQNEVVDSMPFNAADHHNLHS